MKQAAEIIFFIFICGGAFAIIQTTGAIDASISRAVLSSKARRNCSFP
jgi:uncharacterized ion transporter superfamily protein YfcC